MIVRVNDVNESSNAHKSRKGMNMVEAFVEDLEALTYEVSRCADALDALAAEARREETKRQRTEAQERAARMPQDLLSSDEPDF